MRATKKAEQTHIEVISDNQHWGITASTLAFNLNYGEFAILCCLSWLDTTQVFTNSVENFRRTSKHTGCCRADLNKMLADRFPNSNTLLYPLQVLGVTNAPIEHSVESRNLIDAHRRHTKIVGDVIHDANARPSFILPLCEIEEGNDSGLLVLRRIVRNNFLSALCILGIEFESNLVKV